MKKSVRKKSEVKIKIAKINARSDEGMRRVVVDIITIIAVHHRLKAKVNEILVNK